MMLFTIIFLKKVGIRYWIPTKKIIKEFYLD